MVTERTVRETTKEYDEKGRVIKETVTETTEKETFNESNPYYPYMPYTPQINTPITTPSTTPLNQQWYTTVNTTETNPNTIKTTYTNDTDGSALSSISNAVNTIGYLEVRG